jgi:predicted Zn-dependent protease with MMP-like domain
VLRMGREDFERVVTDALDDIPEELSGALENLVVVVEEEPSEEELLDAGLDPETETLFGLYHGTALPERGFGSFGGGLPDRIVIYRQPLLRECSSRRELLREIRATVVHEVGHYFGLDEDQLP